MCAVSNVSGCEGVAGRAQAMARAARSRGDKDTRRRWSLRMRPRYTPLGHAQASLRHPRTWSMTVALMAFVELRGSEKERGPKLKCGFTASQPPLSLSLHHFSLSLWWPARAGRGSRQAAARRGDAAGAVLSLPSPGGRETPALSLSLHISIHFSFSLKPGDCPSPVFEHLHGPVVRAVLDGLADGGDQGERREGLQAERRFRPGADIGLVRAQLDHPDGL